MNIEKQLETAVKTNHLGVGSILCRLVTSL